MLLRIVLLIFVAVIVSTQNEVEEKRFVLDNDEAVVSAIQTMSDQIAVLTANLTETNRKLAESTAETNRKLAEATANLTETNRKLAETTMSLSNKGIGSTYVRWGRTTCPSNGTDLVYKGFVGGSYYTSTGGTADYICMSGEPLWGFYDITDHSASCKLYGAEYEFGDFRDGGADFFGQNMNQHDVPCAVCRSTRPNSIMIPGRNQCYPGWTMEYSGYLVGGYHVHTAASNYACLDSRPETELGDARNEDGKLMYLVEAVCGSLKCPPYVQNREITCVVCSQ